MAAPTNTLQVVDASGTANPAIMEYLKNHISDVTPLETPFYSMLSAKSTKSYKVEWLVQELNDTTHVARPYGDEYSNEARNNSERRIAYVQSIWRSFGVSDEEEKTTSAGFASRMAYEIMRVGREQKIGVERILVSTAQSSDGPTATAGGKTATLLSTLSDNTSKGTGGVDGGWDAASSEWDVRTDATSGNLRAWTEDQLVEVLRGIWKESDGSDMVTAMVSAEQKAKFNKFSGIAEQRIMNSRGKQAGIIGSANTYQNDYSATPTVVFLNRYMRNRDVFVINPNKFHLKKMWMFRPRYLPVTGNNRRFGMSSNFTLCMENAKEHGGIFDLSV